MKKISTKDLALIGKKRTYSVANFAGLCLMGSTRPYHTLDQASERLKQKRFKKYTPRESEFPLYSPWEFQKQLDIEQMTIRVKEESYREHKNSIVPKYYRQVVRRPDEAGRFKWIEIELREIGQQYSMDMEAICEIFEQVNCDK